MGMKCDIKWWRDDVDRRRGGTREEERKETTPVGLTRILVDQKIKKIHVVNSADTNGQWRFNHLIT
jgi:hypothetical protein